MAKEKRVLVLTYWAFQDALVQTYTLPYLKIMAENPHLRIWLTCLQPKEKKLSKAEVMAIQKSLDNYRISLILLNYKPLSFLGLINTGVIFLQLFFLTVKLKISAIHAWATPAGALGYLLAFPLSKKLVIDSYEPHAEAMVENGTWQRKSLAFRLLFWLERKQTHYAYAVIACTKGMKQYAELKYQKVFQDHFYTKPACVDFHIFDYQINDPALKESLGLKDKIVGLYAGKFGGIYQDKDFFRWLKIATTHWGEKFKLLLLTSHSDEEITTLCSEFEISTQTIIKKFVPHREVAKYMSVASFALTPVKPVPSKRYCTPIKDGEYWAMGLPVIIPQGISDDSDIIRQEKIGYVLERLDEAEFLNSVLAIEKIITDLKVGEKIVKVAKEYRSFEIARKVYEEVYST